MQIKNSIPLIVTSSPEDILPIYVKGLGFKITHNLEFPEVNLLTLENGKARVDVVVNADPKYKPIFKKEYYAIRMNVDDLKATVKALEKQGCKVAMPTIELKSTLFTLVKQPNGLLIGVMQHKAKAAKKVTKK